MRTLEALARSLKGKGAPRLWLFTDPVRLPDPLAAAQNLPRGAGVVARGMAPAPLAALA
ncbi:thiamine phosphate synthase, partial [Roseomonas hellenica]|nr:thiamine phosphate synthase [Plastoroseomonas hellenica]